MSKYSKRSAARKVCHAIVGASLVPLVLSASIGTAFAATVTTNGTAGTAGTSGAVPGA